MFGRDPAVHPLAVVRESGYDADMNRISRALAAGAIGALTTNAAHEALRRLRPDAPRIDLIGMQALARGLAAADVDPPAGRRLYSTTLASDLVANSVYFALAGCVGRDLSAALGTALGIVAGIGAIVLPPRLGLSAEPTSRTPRTSASTVALYVLGGLAAGTALRAMTPHGAGGERFYAGKHVAITGGSRGLGFVLARQLLELGARVTVCGRSPEALASAADRLATRGLVLQTVRADVRDRAECERFIAVATERNGPVDILINNAGVIEVGPAADQRVADYREAMDTHFWGSLYTMLAVVPSMRARGGGRIANVASVGGLVGVPHLAPYSASKFAQVGLAQALGAELRAAGISVTSVLPGLMTTGSPERAIFKGRRRAEYAWFTLSDANPLLAVPADAAAERILHAIQSGRAQAVIGWTAKAAQALNALFPETTAAALQVAARLLPSSGGDGSERHTGAASRSAWTENPLTTPNARAAERDNERVRSEGASGDARTAHGGA
jgi:short-subunit dehydrogenase